MFATSPNFRNRENSDFFIYYQMGTEHSTCTDSDTQMKESFFESDGSATMPNDVASRATAATLRLKLGA
jgi:hypothetical protein